MAEVEHAVTVGAIDGTFRAECCCGWTSFSTHALATADVQAKWHLAERDDDHPR